MLLEQISGSLGSGTVCFIARNVVLLSLLWTNPVQVKTSHAVLMDGSCNIQAEHLTMVKGKEITIKGLRLNIKV